MEESILNTLIDDYFIEDRIKAGGVAVVYRATNRQTNEIVAFKLLQPGWVEHDEILIRFEREASIMRQLNHPHIVGFFGYGRYKGRPYIAMEYLPDGSLSDRIKSLSRISLGGTARLMEQIASALDYAHSKGIVHRDIKPGNILLRGNTHAALTDFGIARLMEHTMLTGLGQMPGTPHYMSPEQARGAEELNFQSDLYSLVIITYLLVVGKLPFSGFDPLVVINQHLTVTPPTPSDINPDLPKEVDRILLKGLEKDPKNRFASVGAFSRAFTAAVRNHEQVTVSVAASKHTPDEPSPDVLDIPSPVFSSHAYTIEAELTYTPLQIESLAERKRRIRRQSWPLIAAEMGAVLVMLIGSIFFLNSGSRGTVTASPTDSSPVGAATTAMTDPTLDLLSTAPTGVPVTASATNRRSVTSPAAPTISPSPTPSLTPSDTLTPTRTYTPTPTPTPTITPSPTVTPFPSLIDWITYLKTNVGTAGRFNCINFLTVYRFLALQLADGNPEYEPARGLLEDMDSPLQLIYENYCRDHPEETRVYVESALFANLRAALDQLP